MKKTLPRINAAALIITIGVNYLSNTGLFNGNTMSTVSEKYNNLFTPAGYAFSIWGLIYLGLLGFVIYTGRSLFGKAPDPAVEKIGWWFVISCIANSFWIVAWLNEFVGVSVLIMIILLISLLKIVVNLRMELDYQPLTRYLFIYWPFALYAGWVSVALIANIAAWLTKIEWDGWGLSDTAWTIIMICVAGLVNIFMILTRNLREYGVVGIWALIAIAVANSDNGESTIVYSGYAIAAVVLIFIFINALKNRQRTFERM